MIPKNELRIGNHVIFTHAKDGESNIINSGFEIDQYADDFMPIPLTAEILVKMGFEKTDHINYSLSLMALSLNCRLYSNRAYFEIPNCLYFGEIKSVHQLQNLYLDITGKELEFKL